MTTDILISFDTTGSMYPALTEVRNRASDTVKRILSIPGARVAIIAHGDYYDKKTTYVTKILPFTSSVNEVVRFINEVKQTNGGDSPECYELVMHEAQNLSWRHEARKAMIMIGDNVPHQPHEKQNYLHLDWREELIRLQQKGIRIYAIHALSGQTPWARGFYEKIARSTSGLYIKLEQFNDVVNTILAICYHQQGSDAVSSFEKELLHQDGLTAAVAETIAAMLHKLPRISSRVDKEAIEKHMAPRSFTTSSSLIPVSPSRFQRFQAVCGASGTSAKNFILSIGLIFAPDKCFYQLVKPEMVQERKEVILMDKRSGAMFNDSVARDMIGLPYGNRGQIKPADAPEGYEVFVQLTSHNRVLHNGDWVLYDIA